MQDADPTRVRRIAGDRDEVDLDGDVADGAGQVGEEDQRPLQHPDEHDAVRMICRDLARQPADQRADRLLIDQGLRSGDRRAH